jgi:hypothetical protein
MATNNPHGTPTTRVCIFGGINYSVAMTAFAIIAAGYVRTTADVDLLIDANFGEFAVS